MRVIAGKYRGKKLIEFDINSTRPTLDRVKEALFSSIQFDLCGAVVLDLFSGTGALGIEAISRGAKKVYFVDKNKDAVKVITQNLSGITEDYGVFNVDYETFLKKSGEKFDIILLDPPFATDFGVKAIEMLVANNFLTDNGIIVYEKAKEKVFDANFENFEIKRKQYGTVELIFMRKEN